MIRTTIDWAFYLKLMERGWSIGASRGWSIGASQYNIRQMHPQKFMNHLVFCASGISPIPFSLPNLILLSIGLT